MRLTSKERHIIKTIIADHFGPDTLVLLFGSRADNQKKGGDIDLYIESDLSAEALVERKIECLTDLKRLLGDQKIDLVIKQKQNPNPLVIHEHARTTGVPL